MSSILTVFTLNFVLVGVGYIFLLRNHLFGVSTERQRITVYGDPSEWGGYPDEQKGWLWLIQDNLKDIDVLVVTVVSIIVAMLFTAYFVAMEWLVGAL